MLSDRDDETTQLNPAQSLSENERGVSERMREMELEAQSDSDTCLKTPAYAESRDGKLFFDFRCIV